MGWKLSCLCCLVDLSFGCKWLLDVFLNLVCTFNEVWPNHEFSYDGAHLWQLDCIHIPDDRLTTVRILVSWEVNFTVQFVTWFQFSGVLILCPFGKSRKEVLQTWNTTVFSKTSLLNRSFKCLVHRLFLEIVIQTSEEGTQLVMKLPMDLKGKYFFFWHVLFFAQHFQILSDDVLTFLCCRYLPFFNQHLVMLWYLVINQDKHINLKLRWMAQKFALKSIQSRVRTLVLDSNRYAKLKMK